MKYGRLLEAGILTIGTLAGAASAASPTKGDMDFCNMKAAQVSKAPTQPGAGATTRQPAPGTRSARPVMAIGVMRPSGNDGASRNDQTREVNF